MAGLPLEASQKHVDARDECGHDGGEGIHLSNTL
jgi:hypothetical protein